MPGPVIVFQDAGVKYCADTCEPLKAAAASGKLALAGWSRGSYPGRRLPPNDLRELRSVGVWDARWAQGWGLDLHCNEGIELTYVSRGSVAFEVDRRTWALRQGQFTVTRPWQFHRVGDPHITPCRLIWIILDVQVRRPNQPWLWPPWLLFSARDRERLTRLLSHNEEPVWEADEPTARAFENLADLLEAPALDGARMKLRINELFLEVRECLERRQIVLRKEFSSSRRVVELFLDRLAQHLDQPWTLATMAAKCGLSRSSFASYCLELTNASPIAYLARVRMEAALAMLRAPEAPSITRIALACGFNSSQYFATRFKRRFGCRPSEWRQRP
jgi:AraC family L-rhamnose operon regulatory protein RhaS